jgi:AcrR family transcriptional regulator
MRAHLLNSVLEVCSGESARSPAVIDDVVQHASVSRGTFYKYFDSLDQAIEELGIELADEMTAGIADVYDVLEEPVQRTATGFQLFLIRAMMEPQWGAFISHIGLLREGDLITTKIRQDIAQGVESGDYVVPSIEIASDLLMGAKYEAIRRIISSKPDAAYISSVASMVLRAFGVSPAKADKVAKKAFARLLIEAPARLPWWNSASIS